MIRIFGGNYLNISKYLHNSCSANFLWDYMRSKTKGESISIYIVKSKSVIILLGRVIAHLPLCLLLATSAIKQFGKHWYDLELLKKTVSFPVNTVSWFTFVHIVCCLKAVQPWDRWFLKSSCSSCKALRLGYNSNCLEDSEPSHLIKTWS